MLLIKWPRSIAGEIRLGNIQLKEAIAAFLFFKLANSTYHRKHSFLLTFLLTNLTFVGDTRRHFLTRIVAKTVYGTAACVSRCHDAA